MKTSCIGHFPRKRPGGPVPAGRLLCGPADLHLSQQGGDRWPHHPGFVTCWDQADPIPASHSWIGKAVSATRCLNLVRVERESRRPPAVIRWLCATCDFGSVASPQIRESLLAWM